LIEDRECALSNRAQRGQPRATSLADAADVLLLGPGPEHRNEKTDRLRPHLRLGDPAPAEFLGPIAQDVNVEAQPREQRIHAELFCALERPRRDLIQGPREVMRVGTHARVHQFMRAHHSLGGAETEGHLEHALGQVATRRAAHGRSLLDGPGPQYLVVVATVQEFGEDDPARHVTAPIVRASSTPGAT
jgi:hypothetical protein